MAAAAVAVSLPVAVGSPLVVESHRVVAVYLLAEEGSPLVVEGSRLAAASPRPHWPAFFSSS